MAKILVTGASGFIGKRLIVKLLEQGDEIYALSRGKRSEFNSDKVHLILGDLNDPSHMEEFPQDIEAAYYLVHSMGHIVENLEEVEKSSCKNFLRALSKTNCKQVIYLGGIIEDEAQLSVHLRSRLSVEKVLKEGAIPYTILRASIIIGSGSASFEIIRDLVEKLPVMVAPKWVESYCQPIAVRDVLFYLTHLLLKKESYRQTYDLGGPEAMTFREVLLRYAKFRHLKRFIINVPVLTPKLSSYWLVFITSVRFSICKHLVESMKLNTRKLNLAIDEVLPHTCMSYEKGLELAFQRIAQNEIVSTWMDAWDCKGSPEGLEVPLEGCLKDIREVSLEGSFKEVIERIWSIGGKKGWYSMNWAWKLRGLFDQFIGGRGLNRGRRHPTEIAVGDSLDFWRVLVADKKNGHLILFAQMKLPGEAWLEFKVNGTTLIQIATFRPRGIWGRVYWYCLYPFHWIIFTNMARSIASCKK